MVPETGVKCVLILFIAVVPKSGDRLWDLKYLKRFHGSRSWLNLLPAWRSSDMPYQYPLNRESTALRVLRAILGENMLWKGFS